MTGPDSSGYYALTVTGTTIPTTAVMVTGGLGMTEGYGTSASPLNQTNVSGYPVTVLKDGTGKVTGWQGGINIAAPTKTVTLSGALPAGFPTATTSPNQQIFATTARRAIVEKSRCESCHGSLGNFTSKTFHGGQFNDPTTCAVCHDPNLFDSGWQIASGAWVHEIHSSAKRAADVLIGGALFNIGVGPTWATLEYPGVLRDCLQCHLPGTVNFGNAANATQAGFMTYRTALSGAYTVGPYTAPFGNITSKDYGARFAYNPATGATTDAAAIGKPLICIGFAAC